MLVRLREQVGAPAAIGLSGQMHELLALGARGQVLRPAILWNDQRTGAQCEEIERALGREEVLDALELDAGWLPRLLEGPEVAGHTADGIPVAAGGGDQAAGALGVGVDRPGPASVVLGTSGVVFAALDQFVGLRAPRICCSSPTWPASVPRTPTPTLACVRRAERPTRSRRTGPCGAGGARLWPARLARSDRRARSSAGGRPRLRRWRPRFAVAADRRLGARATARAGGGRRGCRVRGGDPRRVAAGVWHDAHTAVTATVRPGARIEPVPDWVEVYRELRPRFRTLYPALRELP